MPIRKRPTTDQLYWRFQYHGRTYEKSLETSSRREAQSRGMAWEVAEKQRLDAATHPALHPSLAVLRDLDIRRARHESRAVESYIKDGLGNYWKRLLEFFNGDVRDVTAANVKAYAEQRKAAGIRVQTIRKELVCLKRGLRLAAVRPVGADDPDFWPKFRVADQKAGQAVKRHAQSDWQRWLSRLSGSAYETALFAILTGLRWAELYRVRREDIFEAEGGWLTLQVREKVTRTHRRQIVLSPLALLLVDLGCVPFAPLDHKKARLRAAVGNPTGNITLRDCRGAFASVASAVAPGRIVDMAMGHSGVPARYPQEDYRALARIALAVDRWVTTEAGTPAGVLVSQQKVDKWSTL